MTKAVCLFCNCPEKNYKPLPNTDYVCGTCVVLLLEFTQEQLEHGCEFIEECLKTIQRSNGVDKLKLKERYERKKRAIEMFFKEENENEQRKPAGKKRRRHFNREGSVRTFRNRPSRIRQTQAERETAIL